MDKRICNSALIYQATTNGFKAADFHQHCDGKQNVIVMIENTAGERFGGFTAIGFNSTNMNYVNTAINVKSSFGQ